MRKASGLTLVELLVALVMVGILYAFGVFGVSRFYKTTKLSVAAHEIQQAIHLARLEASLHAETIVLKPLGENGQWIKGITLEIEGQEKPNHTLHQWLWHFPPTSEITWHGFESNQSIRFTHALTNRGANGYFLLSDSEESMRIKITINRLGMARIARPPA